MSNIEYKKDVFIKELEEKLTKLKEETGFIITDLKIDWFFSESDVFMKTGFIEEIKVKAL